MAAFEGAGEGNVRGHASIKDFLEGTACVEPPRMRQGWVHGGEGPGEGVKLGVRASLCQSIPPGRLPRIPGDCRPPHVPQGPSSTPRGIPLCQAGHGHCVLHCCHPQIVILSQNCC